MPRLIEGQVLTPTQKRNKEYRENNRASIIKKQRSYYNEFGRAKRGCKKSTAKKVTKREKNYVLKNYLLKTSGIMSDELGVDRNRIKVIMKCLGVKTTLGQRKKLKRKTKTYTEETLKFMRELGSISGKKNPNQYKDGEIIIRTDRNGKNQKYIRLPGKHYQNRIIRLAVYNWEQENGKIPKGYRLDFKDGDSLNCQIENLYIQTRGEFFAKAQNELSDGYVAVKAAKKLNITKEEALLDKELIKTYRALLQLKRKIKGHERGKGD
jgi:hypothetical protein